ncbi:MAG: hypothetical protein GXY20_00040 [Clostridiales bacterium]|nr:hypothetical protein [Clostridiales bacterium]
MSMLNNITNITKRRTFRSFKDEELRGEVLDELSDFLSSLCMPFDGIDWNFDTLPYMDLMRISMRGPGVKAPHYLLLRAEKKAYSLQNSGYLGEMAALWLTGQGIGSCWQGGVAISPHEDFPDSLPYVSTLAFGMSDEPFRADASEAQRQPLDSIAFGQIEPHRPLLEAARLAPSYFNRQKIRFVCDDRGDIHIYRKKVMLNNPVFSYQDCVSAGASIAHLQTAADALGLPNRFAILKPSPGFKRYLYQATLKLGSNAAENA